MTAAKPQRLLQFTPMREAPARRHSRFHLAALLLGLLCAGTATASDAALTGVRIEPLRTLAERGDPIELGIEDSWPSACVPTLQRVEVRGRDIRVIAREPAEAAQCIARPSRYRIDTRVARGPAALLAEPGVLRVHYIVESNLGEQLRGFDLLPTASASAAALPEAGLWWPDPAQPSAHGGPGIGLALERQGDQFGLQVFGYDGEGRPEWTMASGRSADPVVRLPLTRFAGGSGPRNAYSAPREGQLIGQLLLEPISPSKSLLWLSYDQGDGGIALRQIPIARFALAGSAAAHWSGSWLLALPAGADGFGRSLELEFGPALPRRGGFLLLDEANGAELDCEFPGTEWTEVPAFCRLRLPEAGIDALIERLALQSMQGTDASGGSVRMFRLHP